MKKIRVFQNESYKKLGDLYGLFFEDINHAADGGLYAELIQNRSFEFCEIDNRDYTSFTAWEKSDNASWEVLTASPLNKENTHYLRVDAKKGAYILNKGFNTGIYVEGGKSYDFSIYLRVLGQADTVKNIIVSIEDEKQKIYAKTNIQISPAGINSDGNIK